MPVSVLARKFLTFPPLLNLPPQLLRPLGNVFGGVNAQAGAVHFEQIRGAVVQNVLGSGHACHGLNGLSLPPREKEGGSMAVRKNR